MSNISTIYIDMYRLRTWVRREWEFSQLRAYLRAARLSSKLRETMFLQIAKILAWVLIYLMLGLIGFMILAAVYYPEGYPI